MPKDTVKDRLDALKKEYGSIAKAKNEILKRKLNILENGDNIFFDSIASTSTSIYNKSKKILDSFTIRDGRIDKDDTTNKKIVDSLNKRLKGILEDSTLSSKTSKFLRNFDEVEILAKQLIELFNEKRPVDAFSLSLSEEKRQAIEQVTNGLLTEQAQKTHIRNPIKSILRRHAVQGVKYKEAEDELRRFIKGDQSAGFLERYVRTIAMDTLNQYDGIINQTAMSEFDMDGYSYVGSLIKTSRPQCIRWVIEFDGFIRNEELEAEIAWAKANGSGYGKLTTLNASNFAIIRGGHGCRHSAIPGFDV